MQFGLPDQCYADICAVLRQTPHVSRALIFGSRALGTHRNGSDIDLALFGAELAADDVSRIRRALDERPYAYTYDLVIYDQLTNPAVKAHIDDLGVNFYQRTERTSETAMSSKGWKNIKLEEAIEFKNGKSSPERKEKGSNPVFGGNGIIGYTEKANSESETIVVGRVGAYCGSVYFYKGKCWVTDNAIIGKVRENYEGTYLFYFLKWLDLNNHRTGSSQPLVNQTILNSIQIRVPADKETQRRIAAILSALDDKIELNRQTNATLEAMAQAIFKEWFVDFHFPGSTTLTTGGASGEMQDSELGMIPRGWRTGKLGDVCKNIRKTIHPKEVDPNTAYVGLEHIPRKSLGLLSWGISEDVDSQKTHFKKYHILFGKLRPYFHKVCIAPVDGICSTDILVIEPITSSFLSFCLNHLFSDELIAYVSAIADGTRMPRVDWKSISNYEVVLPPDDLLAEFNENTFALYENIIENNQQSATLAAIRDALLPKLMAGEIDL